MITRLILAVPLVVAGWLAVLAAMTFTGAPAYVAIFPPGSMAGLPGEGAFLGGSAVSVTLTSEDPGFARELYRQGAWLVLPSGLKGCAA